MLPKAFYLRISFILVYILLLSNLLSIISNFDIYLSRYLKNKDFILTYI